ncbi:MAG: hypothetical protein K8S21_01150 [Gemmatimonadetes bacterium]|nr:hypothetical protein [Gemmatimonadota bacterium]
MLLAARRAGIRLALGAAALVATATATETASAQEPVSERPSWVLGGVLPIGIMLPLSPRWALRADIGARGWQQPLLDSHGWNAAVGAAILRRWRPSGDASPYGAFRYVLEISQEDAAFPRWNHHAIATIGGEVKLRGRFGLFGETGVNFRYFERGPAAARVSGHEFSGIARVGLLVRWKDRAK